MNIGLSYMTQIRGGEDTGQLVGDTPEEERKPGASSRSLGGWIALTFNQLVASLTAGYHVEHNANDSHSTIRATGTIAERGRVTPMGEWIAVPFALLTFSGNGAQTWTPTAASTSVRYMVIGKTVFVNITIATSSVGGTPNNQLIVTFADNFFQSVALTRGFARMVDSGVVTNGEIVVQASVPRSVFFVRQDFGNFTGSAGTTSVFGELFYEVA